MVMPSRALNIFLRSALNTFLRSALNIFLRSAHISEVGSQFSKKRGKKLDSPSDSMATAEEILKLHDEKGAEVAVLKGKVQCASPQSHAFDPRSVGYRKKTSNRPSLSC